MRRGNCHQEKSMRRGNYHQENHLDGSALILLDACLRVSKLSHAYHPFGAGTPGVAVILTAQQLACNAYLPVISMDATAPTCPMQSTSIGHLRGSALPTAEHYLGQLPSLARSFH